MSWREHRLLELALPARALVDGFQPQELTLFLEGSGARAGERLALLLASPPLPHKALVRGIVSAVRRVGGPGLPVGYQCKIHPRDGERLKRLVAAVSGGPASFASRRHERVPGAFRVEYAVGFARAPGRLVDGSLGGAYIQLEPGAFAPREGGPVELVVEMPGILRRKIALSGRVAWSDPDRGFGVEFAAGLEEPAGKLVRALTAQRRS